MTTLCFFSATGGELTLVSQALARMRADGINVTLFGRTKDQLLSLIHISEPTRPY